MQSNRGGRCTASTKRGAEAAVTRLADCCVDVIVENIEAAPTCRPELAQTVQELQAILKADPTKVETLKQQMKELGIFDADSMRASSDALPLSPIALIGT